MRPSNLLAVSAAALALSLPLSVVAQKTSKKPVKVAEACDNKAETAAQVKAQTVAPGTIYGTSFAAASARPVGEVRQLLGTRTTAPLTLVGKAEAVCQAKGCWLTLALPDGQKMRVKFKDYAFFVPKDIAGRTVVVNGVAQREVVSVAAQQHYAKDAGKSAQEIAAITKPQEQLNFEADGVLIQGRL
ncbi:DUF4920 domain-containing protein [Hymenobacter endophyticus]|uniref:DUF4920 domain-containing protein n=1 Tax=Hymenobacter endophyticus TaxID=3076335 RepID=A0ABU3TFU8_9BACT|nr:DUF4920 domain-containing protein [Hymenobacter endophyticus]MDU0370229.1 DUF4920 domain-containing protein [Hymenobacter endophyticus]